MGRCGVKVIIDKEFLEKLQSFSKLQCTDQEICAVLDITTETLRQWEKTKPEILETIKKGRAEGIISLRRAQWRNAIEGKNVTMQIWLGKQYLGQTDKQESMGYMVIEERMKRWTTIEETAVTLTEDDTLAQRH